MTDAAALIGRTRLPSGSEKEVQSAIADALTAGGFAFEREVDLGDGDIIDFVVDTVGIEVKIKGARRAILRQLQRYARHERLTSLALVSSVAMGLPASIGAKSVQMVSIGRAWL